MELRQLECFVRVVDDGGFGRAAQRLFIVQAAVGQQVARLERALGVRLFDRSTRRVTLTAAGRRLLPEARAALAAAERVTRVAEDLASVRAEATLRVGSSRAFADRVHRALDDLAERAPGLRVRLVQDTRERRLEAVRGGKLDAALVRGEQPRPGLAVDALWQDPLVVAVPVAHPAAALDRVRPADLAGLPVRLAPRAHNPAFHDLVTGALLAAGVEPLPGPAFTTLQDTLAELVADAAAGVPSWTVFDPVGGLPPVRRVAFRPWDGPPSTAFLVRREGAAPQAVERLVAALRDSALTPAGN
ncbi:LysR family transcriptional regulator [Streptomyces sp. NPDC059009]|uniref:LysR family transcriptional regulator n=1 Tax=Streptomyces sp. NPDC059009 TaxID=3346694 RepID=UPI00367832BB